jgi:FMN reductase
MSGPFIVGIGGTPRPGSSTERALGLALRHAEKSGARTRIFGGDFLERLPHFNPAPVGPTPDQVALAQAIREADGVIVATPGYHGSLSGVVKNALDTLELTRDDPRPYFQGRAVGVIITADGAQAGGTTLMAVRGIIHAMRGWPTPFGAALNAANLFDDTGQCRDAKDTWQITTVADQVMEFAQMRSAKTMGAATKVSGDPKMSVDQ